MEPLTFKAQETERHATGTTVVIGIAQRHMFYSGCLGTVVKSDENECTVELFVPLLIQGLKFSHIQEKHGKLKRYHTQNWKD